MFDDVTRQRLIDAFTPRQGPKKGVSKKRPATPTEELIRGVIATVAFETGFNAGAPKRIEPPIEKTQPPRVDSEVYEAFSRFRLPASKPTE